MQSSKKKKSLFGKVMSVLSGKPEDMTTSSTERTPQVNSPSREPVDLQFVKNFTASGGKFLYCEKENEAYEFLQQIAAETGVQHIFCKDDYIRSILNKADFRNLAERIERADAYACNCEYLVSFTGGIMVSDRQTMGKKLSELPEIFITVAYTSQIVENLREGLARIRNTHTGKDLPSQITTVKGPHVDTNQDEAAGSTCKKEIYLLLLEDQF